MENFQQKCLKPISLALILISISSSATPVEQGLPILVPIIPISTMLKLTIPVMEPVFLDGMIVDAIPHPPVQAEQVVTKAIA